MSEKLTVAELLARNARSSSDGSSNRPRRRRRSLEEGGISVAELTGSIPVVTQQDVDEHEEKKAKAEQAEAKKTATIKPVGATPAAGPSVPAAGEKSEKAEAQPAEKSAFKPGEKAGDKSAEGTNLVKRKAEKPGETTNQMKAVPDTAAATSATAAATSATTAKADKHAGDSEAPAAGNADKTTGQQKVAEQTKATEQKKTSDEKISDKKAAEQIKSDQRKTDAEQKTREAEAKAKDTEAKSKDTAQSGTQGAAVATAAKAVPADDARKAEAKLTSKSGAAAGVAGVAGAAGAASLAGNSGSKDSKKDAEAQPGTAAKAKQNSADKSKADDRSKADKEDLKTDAPDEFKELEASLGEDEVIDYEDNTVSWPMMILQAILAVAAGVGIFFGFSLLWANLNPLIVIVLALAVTLVLVGLVHALLRHKDKLLMVLAFFVGLALTIGPRLVMGL
ncbi:hypothetical protein CUROG_09305 [Corynebacterium urogenitale]|uniref:Uncharacterized protein n=1 Tax=Corynebacterium urogenitale TaxID=2487892 RepID=A0A5J6ZBY8_9CORY|nr:DUF2157 domain-containing protein [Corynebacterium urogenitale]QFQ03205.1 hypothetical protein CUROG_09305 [Corynebacterium urogenitale]